MGDTVKINERLLPISVIAGKLGISEKDYISYGSDKAKLSLSLLDKPKKGKLILMTAMSPTPSGEGKTTMNIGLSMGLNALGYSAISALREPSLGPVFGLKGGATGGGKSTIEPSVDINLHFTGDIHAISSANNLLSSMIDNHIFQGNELNIDPLNITWKRAIDMNDRALRKVSLKHHDTSFDISAASEIMAIVCLAQDLEDLRSRLSNIVVAKTIDGKTIYARDLGAVGSMMVLLKDAIKPNLVQTSEGTPVIVHGGPFANIAHGCNSVIATKMALSLSDYVVTEAGFGADLGAQKFFDIKSVQSGLKADAVVIVATLKALKYHGNKDVQDSEALVKGFNNLKQHIENMKKYQENVCVALNKFPDDTLEDIELLSNLLSDIGVPCIVSDVFGLGSQGSKELAQYVVKSLETSSPSKSLPKKSSIQDSVELIAKEIYRAKDVVYSEKALKSIESLSKDYGDYPVCIAKTQYSFSDNPKLLNVASDFSLYVSDVRISAGAGFVVVLCGKVMTMPGMPKQPNALDIDIDSDGNVTM